VHCFLTYAIRCWTNNAFKTAFPCMGTWRWAQSYLYVYIMNACVNECNIARCVCLWVKMYVCVFAKVLFINCGSCVLGDSWAAIMPHIRILSVLLCYNFKITKVFFCNKRVVIASTHIRQALYCLSPQPAIAIYFTFSLP